MKILVTGHLGFIGPSLIRRFKAAGHHVTGLDTGYFLENISKSENWTAPDDELIKDMRKIEAADFEGFDAVVHMAGLSNDPLGKMNENLTYDINLHSSNRAGDFAKAAGVKRFVFFSSCSLYGVADTSKPINETAPQAPVTAYAKSKVGTEDYLREIASDDFSPVFLRNATCYGISARPRFDLVVNSLSAYGFYEKKIKILSDGTPWRPMVHIEDVAQAALCAIEADRNAVHAEAFNVGRNEDNYQIKDMAHMVGKKLPEAQVTVVGETGGDDRSYRVDFTKINKNLPGFKAEWTVDKGIDQILEWCRTNKNLSIDDIHGRGFIRLQQINHLLETNQIDNELHWL